MILFVCTGNTCRSPMAAAMARKMVTVYGMSEKLGAVCFDSGHDEVFLGRSMSQQGRGYSEEVAARIDSEVKAIIDEAYRRCEQMLEQYREQMVATANCLLEKETISGEEFAALMGFEKVKHSE